MAFLRKYQVQACSFLRLVTQRSFPLWEVALRDKKYNGCVRDQRTKACTKSTV